MKLIELQIPPNAHLENDLAEFESQFYYPLGEKERFCISHSPDYTAFYRSIGDARIWILKSKTDIIATISTVIRTITFQGSPIKIVYMGDLKIHPNHQSGRMLFKLTQHLKPLFEPSVVAAYGIVMDGTKITPDLYTGRLGIPKFKPVSRVHILRFKTGLFPGDDIIILPNDGWKLYKDLNNGAYTELAHSEIRSALKPRWFSSNNMACGMVEDTRLAKKLFLESGEELLSAHLSYFAFNDVLSGICIIQQSLNHAHRNNIPALFVALSEKQFNQISPFLHGLTYTTAAATIYSTDDLCKHIPINTAEI